MAATSSVAWSGPPAFSGRSPFSGAWPLSPPTVRRLQLWCHPLVAGALVALLGLFWVGRKRQGLI